ncbi:MAG: energy transducer TonB [Rhodocyclaceae bacterium]|nr:energy transducer TonB [Rhodocyclaceae bacterium]MDZ4214696.1 energy transducer TonB [Rhodocyclaceae bacterium]
MTDFLPGSEAVPNPASTNESPYLMRLAACLLGSCVLHALLLTLPSGGSSGSTVTSNRPHLPPLRVRLGEATEINAPLATTPSTSSTRSVSTGPQRDVVPEMQDATPPGEMGLAAPYYAMEDLSRPPEALTEYGPAPHDTPEGRAGGKARLRVWINRAGLVDRVTLLDSNLPDILTQAAITAFQVMRFRPGEISGRPVASWSEIDIEYEALPDPVIKPDLSARGN